jgi:hypothetical protein
MQSAMAAAYIFRVIIVTQNNANALGYNINILDSDKIALERQDKTGSLPFPYWGIYTSKTDSQSLFKYDLTCTPGLTNDDNPGLYDLTVSTCAWGTSCHRLIGYPYAAPVAWGESTESLSMIPLESKDPNTVPLPHRIRDSATRPTDGCFRPVKTCLLEIKGAGKNNDPIFKGNCDLLEQVECSFVCYQGQVRRISKTVPCT